MFIAVIDKENTWLLDIRDKLDIDLESLEKEWPYRYFTWVINVEGISELIKGFDISPFVIKHPERGLEEITKEQASMLFEAMDKMRKKKRENVIKK